MEETIGDCVDLTLWIKKNHIDIYNQFLKEKKSITCKHSNCIEVVTMDYNGDKVCEYHYKKLNDYFDEEYR
jgi:hypothetical protein